MISLEDTEHSIEEEMVIKVRRQTLVLLVDVLQPDVNYGERVKNLDGVIDACWVVSNLKEPT